MEGEEDSVSSDRRKTSVDYKTKNNTLHSSATTNEREFSDQTNLYNDASVSVKISAEYVTIIYDRDGDNPDYLDALEDHPSSFARFVCCNDDQVQLQKEGQTSLEKLLYLSTSHDQNTKNEDHGQVLDSEVNMAVSSSDEKFSVTENNDFECKKLNDNRELNITDNIYSYIQENTCASQFLKCNQNSQDLNCVQRQIEDKNNKNADIEFSVCPDVRRDCNVTEKHTNLSAISSEVKPIVYNTSQRKQFIPETNDQRLSDREAVESECQQFNIKPEKQSKDCFVSTANFESTVPNKLCSTSQGNSFTNNVVPNDALCAKEFVEKGCAVLTVEQIATNECRLHVNDIVSSNDFTKKPVMGTLSNTSKLCVNALESYQSPSDIQTYDISQFTTWEELKKNKLVGDVEKCQKDDRVITSSLDPVRSVITEGDQMNSVIDYCDSKTSSAPTKTLNMSAVKPKTSTVFSMHNKEIDCNKRVVHHKNKSVYNQTELCDSYSVESPLQGPTEEFRHKPSSSKVRKKVFRGHIVLMAKDTCIAEVYSGKVKKLVYCSNDLFQCTKHDTCSETFTSLSVGDPVLCYILAPSYADSIWIAYSFTNVQMNITNKSSSRRNSLHLATTQQHNQHDIGLQSTVDAETQTISTGNIYHTNYLPAF